MSESSNGIKEKKKSKKNSSSNKGSNLKWLISVFVTTFILSLIFSFISTNSINNLSLIPAIIILIAVIFIGILFDLIAVSVTVADENHFHAKASKKIKGAKTSIRIIKNSAKVANFCADVIGDICGVLSGAISAIVALKIGNTLNLSFNLQFIMSALVSAFTVGGKAIGKSIAQNKSTEIVHLVGKFISNFQKEK